MDFLGEFHSDSLIPIVRLLKKVKKFSNQKGMPKFFFALSIDRLARFSCSTSGTNRDRGVPERGGKPGPFRLKPGKPALVEFYY